MSQMVDKQRHLSHSNGLRSQLRNPKGRHYHAIQIVLIIGLALSIACLCIRLYIRRLLYKKFTTEDSKYLVFSHLEIINLLNCLEYKNHIQMQNLPSSPTQLLTLYANLLPILDSFSDHSLGNYAILQLRQ